MWMSAIWPSNMAPGGRNFFSSMSEWSKTKKNWKNALLIPSHYFRALFVFKMWIESDTSSNSSWRIIKPLFVIFGKYSVPLKRRMTGISYNFHWSRDVDSEPEPKPCEIIGMIRNWRRKKQLRPGSRKGYFHNSASLDLTFRRHVNIETEWASRIKVTWYLPTYHLNYADTGRYLSPMYNLASSPMQLTMYPRYPRSVFSKHLPRCPPPTKVLMFSPSSRT